MVWADVESDGNAGGEDCGDSGASARGEYMVVLVVVVMLITKNAQVKLEDWAGFPLTTLSIWNKYKDVRSLIIVPL